METLESLNAAIDTASHTISETIKAVTGGQPRADRIAITMCLILNAISQSPDLPATIKDGLGDSLCGPRLPKRSPSRKQKRLTARIKSVGAEQALADPEFSDFVELAESLSVAVICTLLSHLDLVGWRERDRVDVIMAYALSLSILMLDADADGEIKEFGGACRGMYQVLDNLKQTLPVAA